MKKVFCFGEVLLRYSPDANGHWLSNGNMPVFIGGAELNVATALSRWNVPAKYCSALPDSYLSEAMVQYINALGIDTSAMHYSGERVGTYYLLQGKDLKHNSVIYDRAGSSFAQLTPGMIDWDAALQDVSWLHITAISPALNQNVVAVCKEGLQAATQKGITISVDLNYRSKLWQYGCQPVEIMPQLAEYCNVIMGNIWAANTLLGIPVDEHIHDKKSRQAYLDHSAETARRIQERFPACNTVANTFRFDENETGIRYYTSLHTTGGQFFSPEFTANNILNKVGSGDCFMGGLIYGLYHQHAPQQVINFAASAAFGKLNEAGDVTHQSIETIQNRLDNNG